MIAIEQLRYVRLGTPDLQAAVDFAQRVLGLELVERTGAQASFKSDFRDHTLVYVEGDPADQACGFEVRHLETLDEAARALAAMNIPFHRGNADETSVRKVKAFGWFNDASGHRIELAVRPMNSGWRYFPSRDAGITGLAAIALRSIAPEADQAIWTKLFNGRVSDWVGEAAYIRFDDRHHQLAIHPGSRGGLLSVEYGVETVDAVMQGQYALQALQQSIVHGPGRRPVSGQAFLTFAGPDGVYFSFVTEAAQITAGSSHRPRQFPREPRSFCAWGSESRAEEFQSGQK